MRCIMKTRKIRNSIALIGGALGFGSFINYKTNCKAVSQKIYKKIPLDYEKDIIITDAHHCRLVTDRLH